MAAVLPAKFGCSTWSRWSPVIRMIASRREIFQRLAPRPVPFVMSTAMRSAAAPVRLPTRVWSIQSFPCSMVNSVSHMSR